MSPQKAAIVNALVPTFLGLVLVVYGFFQKPAPIDPETDPKAKETAEANARKRRKAILGGIALILLGFYGAWQVMRQRW